MGAVQVSAYPRSLDGLPEDSSPGDLLSDVQGVGHADLHNDVAAAINNIQEFIGVSNDSESILDRLDRKASAAATGAYEVVAGNGLVGGGLVKDKPSLDVGAGEGVSVSDTSVSLDRSVVDGWYDAKGTADQAVLAHKADVSDPHPVYLTKAEAASVYPTAEEVSSLGQKVDALQGNLFYCGIWDASTKRVAADNGLSALGDCFYRDKGTGELAFLTGTPDPAKYERLYENGKALPAFEDDMVQHYFLVYGEGDRADSDGVNPIAPTATTPVTRRYHTGDWIIGNNKTTFMRSEANGWLHLPYSSRLQLASAVEFSSTDPFWTTEDDVLKALNALAAKKADKTTRIVAGRGLTVTNGTIADDVSLSINFAPTGPLAGSADTVARSDHSHPVPTAAQVTIAKVGTLSATNVQDALFQMDVNRTTGLVSLTGDQTVAGTKTFSSVPVLSQSATANNHALTLGQANAAYAAKSHDDTHKVNVVVGAGTQSMTLQEAATYLNENKAQKTHQHTKADITDLTTEVTNASPIDVAVVDKAPSSRAVKTELNNKADKGTKIIAGTGLSVAGGTLAADSTVSVNFAGSGSAPTAARSDHTHTIANNWIKAGAGLILTGADTDTTQRTLSANLTTSGGTNGTATTVARGDHRHTAAQVGALPLTGGVIEGGDYTKTPVLVVTPVTYRAAGTSVIAIRDQYGDNDIGLGSSNVLTATTRAFPVAAATTGNIFIGDNGTGAPAATGTVSSLGRAFHVSVFGETLKLDSRLGTAVYGDFEAKQNLLVRSTDGTAANSALGVSSNGNVYIKPPAPVNGVVNQYVHMTIPTKTEINNAASAGDPVSTANDAYVCIDKASGRLYSSESPLLRAETKMDEYEAKVADLESRLRAMELMVNHLSQE